MSDYVTLKVPRWAADLAFEMTAKLAQRGTGVLPSDVYGEMLRRGHNSPTLSKGATVAVALLLLKKEIEL